MALESRQKTPPALTTKPFPPAPVDWLTLAGGGFLCARDMKNRTKLADFWASIATAAKKTSFVSLCVESSYGNLPSRVKNPHRNPLR